MSQAVLGKGAIGGNRTQEPTRGLNGQRLEALYQKKVSNETIHLSLQGMKDLQTLPDAAPTAHLVLQHTIKSIRPSFVKSPCTTGDTGLQGIE